MMHYNIQNPEDVRDLSSIMPTWIKSGNPKRLDWAKQPPKTSDSATWQNGQWVDLSPSDIAANTYNTARSNLAVYWASQPAWIRGPFDASYQSAVSLLDRHDIDAATAIITYTPIPSSYEADQVSAFETVRATLLAGLESLPAIAQE
jgi:hypothetical protein